MLPGEDTADSNNRQGDPDTIGPRDQRDPPRPIPEPPEESEGWAFQFHAPRILEATAENSATPS